MSRIDKVTAQNVRQTGFRYFTITGANIFVYQIFVQGRCGPFPTKKLMQVLPAENVWHLCRLSIYHTFLHCQSIRNPFFHFHIIDFCQAIAFNLHSIGSSCSVALNLSLFTYNYHRQCIRLNNIMQTEYNYRNQRNPNKADIWDVV